MDLQQIYIDTNFRDVIDEVYRSFKKRIDMDPDYSLTDDEIFELFVDLLGEYQKEYNDNFKN